MKRVPLDSEQIAAADQAEGLLLLNDAIDRLAAVERRGLDVDRQRDGVLRRLGGDEPRLLHGSQHDVPPVGGAFGMPVRVVRVGGLDHARQQRCL